MLPFVASVFAQGALIGSEALVDRIRDIPTDVDNGLTRAEDARRFDSDHHRFQRVISGSSRP